MAKTFTNDEKREIEEKAKYILTAMDDIGKNGDAYCTDEQLFRASKAVRPSLTGQRTHGPRRAWEKPGCKLSGRRFVELHWTGRRR